MPPVALRYALVAALVVAAACGGDDDDVTGPVYGAPRCDPGGIRATLAASLPGDDVPRAIPVFNAALEDRDAGRDAAANRAFVRVANVALTSHAAGELRAAPGHASARAAAEWVATALLDCAGQQPATDALRAALDAVDAREPDDGAALCVLAPDIPSECVNAAQNTVALLQAGFVTVPAVLVITSANTPWLGIETPFGRQWSPTWELVVRPLDAQRAPDGATDADVFAVVGLCAASRVENGGPEEDHPARELLAVARDPEGPPPADILERLDAIALQPGEPPVNVAEYLRCDEDEPVVIARRDADSAWRVRLARRASGALERTVGRWLSPAPLYAFDGGIGGKVVRFQSFYAVVRVDGGTAP